MKRMSKEEMQETIGGLKALKILTNSENASAILDKAIQAIEFQCQVQQATRIGDQ